MDLFVRRQSHQVNQQPTDPSDDNEDASQSTEKACRDIYDYRRWEWGNLRVILTPYLPGVYTHFSERSELMSIFVVAFDKSFSILNFYRRYLIILGSFLFLFSWLLLLGLLALLVLFAANRVTICRPNVKIWALSNFIEPMYNDCNAAIYRYFS